MTRPKSVTNIEEPIQGNIDDIIVVEQLYDNNQIAAALVEGRNRPQTRQKALYKDSLTLERYSDWERHLIRFFN